MAAATTRYTCAPFHLPAGEQAIRLEDIGAGLDAAIVPERGAIWSAFGCRDAAGQRQELLHSANDFRAGGCSPVLFPVTGRSRCDGKIGSYRHRGHVYPMPLHGFAKDLPWEVAARGADAESAFVTCRLRDSQATRENYPYPFLVELTYRLRAGEFLIEAAVENPGAELLPFHLGFHPYFQLPGDRRAALLSVPSRSVWELKESCATGERLPLAEDEAYDPERALGDASLDTVFAGLRPEGQSGLARTAVRNPESGWTVTMRHDPAQFPVFVVYTPNPEPYVCLEPWTGLPGGLGDDTPAGKSARFLAPGERFAAVVRVQAAGK